MSRKSWYLNRRTLLQGASAALALPWMECMGSQPAHAQAKRFCGIYFPFGVSLPDETGDQAHWRWFPTGAGKDYQFNKSLEPLTPHRDQLTILGGLSHPHGRSMGAHDTGDTFLTAALLDANNLRNSVSLDQVIAERVGTQTRFASLTLSTDGGVGEPTRASTLSYNNLGYPIPALNQPKQVFDRLFGAGDESTAVQQRQIVSSSAMLDRVLSSSRDLRRKLGTNDQRKLDEYLSAVREIEHNVNRAQAWLEIPRPELSDADRHMLQLEADDQAPLALIQTMYDLIYLAFRTDSTRVVTYQIASMADASSKAGKFPQLQGFQGSLHNLAHDWNKPNGAENLGKWDRFMAERLSHFLQRLADCEDSEATLLDRSVVLYGSSNSQTHNNRNYPLVLAGGSQLGMQHGSFIKQPQESPLANLFVTILNRVGVPAENFADSTGELTSV